MTVIVKIQVDTVIIISGKAVRAGKEAISTESYRDN